MSEQIAEDDGALAGTSKPRSAKKVPDFMKSFGWCTWDAFYSQVSAQGVVFALRSHCPSHGPSWDVIKQYLTLEMVLHKAANLHWSDSNSFVGFCWLAILLCGMQPHEGIQQQSDSHMYTASTVLRRRRTRRGSTRLEALRAGGVAPKLLIITDGWLSSCVESPSDSFC